jgi:hypothetical protein
MPEEYTIEQLEKTFKSHAQKNIIQRQRDLENFQKNYPDSEIPAHMLNDFCISEALHVICREINELKKQNMYKRRKEMFPGREKMPSF